MPELQKCWSAPSVAYEISWNDDADQSGDDWLLVEFACQPFGGVAFQLRLSESFQAGSPKGVLASNEAALQPRDQDGSVCLHEVRESRRLMGAPQCLHVAVSSRSCSSASCRRNKLSSSTPVIVGSSTSTAATRSIAYEIADAPFSRTMRMSLLCRPDPSSLIAVEATVDPVAIVTSDGRSIDGGRAYRVGTRWAKVATEREMGNDPGVVHVFERGGETLPPGVAVG